MSDRNRLSAGDFLVPLPIGYPLSLKYDENGVLTQVLKGYESPYTEDVSVTFLYALINDHIVPNRIALRKGTTYVSGILYTGSKLVGSGKLPECKFQDIIDKFKESRDGFRFFAISVRSLSAVFKGAVPIRQWLTFSKFRVPQGSLLDEKSSGNISTYLFEHNTSNIWNNINFKFPRIPEYAVFTSNGVNYGSFDILEYTVKSTKRVTLDSGVIDCKISFNECKDPMVVPYSEAVKYNIQKGTTLIYDSNLNILYSDYKSATMLSNQIMCSVCGKIIHVPKSGVTICSDVNCNSRLYSRVKQFLVDLHLPYVSYTRYQEICQAKGLDFHVPDILDVEEFQDTKLKCTAYEVLRAITPNYIMSDDNLLLQFCNTCKNASETIQYYLQCPQDIQVDISSDIEYGIASMVKWYSNEDNMKDLIRVFHHDRIEIISENIEFNGAPIFRNKNIVITGKFVHGNYDFISSILRGYGGSVQDTVDSTTDCIIVGDMLENISGHTIKEGHKYDVPIMSESEFFNRYEIESDIAENL